LCSPLSGRILFNMKRILSPLKLLAGAGLILLLLISCAVGEKSLEPAGFYEEYEDAPAPMEASRSADMMKAESEAPPASSGTGGADISTGSDRSEPAPDRKRVYNGSAGLVVEEPVRTRRQLEELSTASGGYVESSYRDYLVLRIPAERFDEIFRRILAMGTVSYQQVDTWDVTDQYQDTQARLKTAEETRRRLYILLEKSTDPKERTRILREIGRLTEEIESIRQQLQILDSRIAFSRITVELIPRLADDYRQAGIPFPWIANLNPLYPASSTLKASVRLEPGDAFAVFTKVDIYAAEDARGTSITVSTVENTPRGDGAFWQKALLHHLGDYYAAAEGRSLRFGDKELPGVEFLSKDREPFRYFAGVVVDGKRLHVVEIFSPDGEKDFAHLYRKLEEGGLR